MRHIQAANFTPVTHRDITLLVVHDMEFPKTLKAAEDVATFFHNQPKGSNGSSAHVCFDSDSAVSCVFDHDVAWAAPGANHNGWHAEFAGYAKETARDWKDAYNHKMIFEVAAPVFAHRALRYSIPCHIVDAAGLRAGRSGITTHRFITDSGIGGAAGTHQDPGPNFPLEDFVKEVRSIKQHLKNL